MSRIMKSGLIGLAACAAVSVMASAQDSQSTSPAKAEVKSAEGPQKRMRRAVPDTLMFTIDEFNDIKDRIAGGAVTKDGTQQQAVTTESLYLGSIVYYGPKDWTVWINGSPIGPNQDFQAFQVTEISPRYVELLVPLSVQGMRPVRLQPNQTFITSSGVTVEGKYP
jgi:hypothetical protein